MDQALFLAMRATGRRAVVQSLWTYDNAVDIDGLKRFHHNLRYGLLGRRIERSPLPFARHRWVACPGPEIDVAESARPRSELTDWADERAQLPIDPELGPGWHLGVLPLTDGSTAVSLVVSHCLVDGLGAAGAIADAVNGKNRDLGYPPPRSRTWLQAVIQDANQTAQDAPAIVRALVAAAKEGRRQRRNGTQSTASQRVPATDRDGEEPVVVPMVTVYVDVDDWDARAKALGGMTHHLLAGFAAKLGERMRRRHSRDGLVTLQLPISDRAEDDTRANALSFVSVEVDPTAVTTDLRAIRVAQGQAFRAQREAPEGSAITVLAPLVSFVPKRLLERVVDAAFAYDELPVGCSNAGDVDPALGRPDGTDASQASARGGEQQVTRGHLERTGGQLTVWAARFGGKVCITVGAYQPGKENSKAALREEVRTTLAEFSLTGVID